MALEIERKFIVSNHLIKPLLAFVNGIHVHQGYLAEAEGAVIRVRTYGDKAFLTIKSSTGEDHVMEEFEYEIPFADGKTLLDKCEYTLTKTRIVLMHGKDKWEIDIFPNNLILAEFEHEDKNKVETVSIPYWIREEVTHDKQYSNFALAKKFTELGGS